MSSPIVENIDRSSLSESQRNGLAILEHLSVADLNEIKRVLKLSNPGVIGPQTLEAFMSLAVVVGLELSNAGVGRFKDDNGLGNTGSLAGVIGQQTASVYFRTVIAAVRSANDSGSGTVFCDFAIRDDQGANDSGPFVSGPPRGVLHTTEGSSFAGARGAFVEHNSWPHFTITHEDGPVVIHQHLPVNVSGRSLEHRHGTVETNRQSAIQIEIVGFAAHSQDFPQSYLDGIARLMRWIELHAGVARTSSVQFVAPGHEQRLSDDAWLNYAGWCGHQHVPHNDHNDPGAIPMAALLRIDAAVAPVS
jgi:hypothetical protein